MGLSGAFLTVDSVLLVLDVLAANEEAGAEVMLLADLAQLVKDLHGQLAGGRYHQRAQPVWLAPLQPVQLLHQLSAVLQYIDK